MAPLPRVTFAELPVDQIRPDPDQPRKTFRADALAELAESIRQVGVLQPIRVRPEGEGWVVIMGERRWRAAKAAGLSTIPCVITTETANIREAQLIENMAREPMEPLEEAAALKELLDRGYAPEALGRALGRRIQPGLFVEDRVRLLGLIPMIRDALLCRAIPVDKAQALTRLRPEQQRTAFLALTSGKVGPGQEFQRMCEAMAAEAQQGALFEIPPATPAERAVIARFDTMIERLERFVRASVDPDDASVLARVLQGNVAGRLARLDLILTYLGKIRLALKHAKAKQLALEQRARVQGDDPCD